MFNCFKCGKSFDFKCRLDAHRKKDICSPNLNFITDNLDELKLDETKLLLKYFITKEKEVEKQKVAIQGKINCEFCNKAISKYNMKKHLKVCKNYVEKPIIKKYSKPEYFIVSDTVISKVKNYFTKLKKETYSQNKKIVFDVLKILYNEPANKNWKLEGQRKDMKFHYKKRIIYFSLEKYLKNNLCLKVYNAFKIIFNNDEITNLFNGRRYNDDTDTEQNNNISFFYEFINKKSFIKYFEVKDNYYDFVYFLQSINEENKKFIKLNFK